MAGGSLAGWGLFLRWHLSWGWIWGLNVCLGWLFPGGRLGSASDMASSNCLEACWPSCCIICVERCISLPVLGQKNTTDWEVLKNGILFRRSSGGQKSKSKVAAVYFLLKPLSLACRWLPSCGVLMWLFLNLRASLCLFLY